MCTKTYDLNNEKKNKDKNIFVKKRRIKKYTKLTYENQTCTCNILMLFFHEAKAKKQDNK